MQARAGAVAEQYIYEWTMSLGVPRHHPIPVTGRSRFFPMLLGSAQPLLLILPWAAIAQRLVGAFLVIPHNPLLNGDTRVRKAPKLVLPHAFLLQRSEPAFNESILFRRIWRNELLW